MKQQIAFTKTPEGLSFLASLVSAGLALTKLFLFLWSGSYIIAVSAWDSFVDSFVSFINKFVIQYARSEADEDHPYGHGKAESLAAMGQGIFVTGGGFILLWSTLSDLIRYEHTPEKKSSYFLIFFFLFCAIVSGLLTKILEKGAKKHQSPALESDAVHYKVDTFMNVGSSIAFLVISYQNWRWLDPLIGSCFSLYVIHLGLRLIFKSSKDLMDTAIDENLKDEVLAKTLALSKDILNIHHFRGRRSGNRLIIDFHASLNEKLSFSQAHKLVETIETFLIENFQADPIIHADPEKKWSEKKENT
jgi:ferrous-iron efflux pump FieF